jgi:15-cis-phytoene synthase
MSLTVDNPDQILALGYAAGAADRRRLTSVFAFDAMIARQVLTAREAVLGQIRLAWWRDQILALSAGGARPSDPVLIEIAALMATGLQPSGFVQIVDGWEITLGEGALTDTKIKEFAKARGQGVFGAALSDVGEGWALVDLASRVTDPDAARRMIDMALPLLSGLSHLPREKGTRALRVLAALALRDAGAGLDARPRPGSPRRAWWALRYALAPW